MRGGASRPPASPACAPPSEATAWLPFGALRRPHGTRGEIFLVPFNPNGDRSWASRMPVRVRWVKAGATTEIDVVAARPVAEGWLVRFATAESREAVAALVGGELQVQRQGLPALAGGEFYVEDIVGCEVYLGDGRRLGRVRGTFWNGAHDVMAVVGDDGEEQFLPVAPGFVLAFDASLRRLTVDVHG